MGIFIYASTATGKTTVTSKYKNIIDMESTLYKYLDVIREDEESKGTYKAINKGWPQNYFEALNDVKDKYDYILIADEICDDFIHSNNYKYWRVYPKLDLKEEYIERCRVRGNNEEFIYWYSKLWNEWYYKCKNDHFALKHIELNSGQYLEDVLPNLK